MKTITSQAITQLVSKLSQEANFSLRKDVVKALKKSCKASASFRERSLLSSLILNARLAETMPLPICQDTGLLVVFLELGSDVRIKGDAQEAIQKGIRQGYKEGYLRYSVVQDPLNRHPPALAGPVVIHTHLVRGARLKITVLPKGFGCENYSRSSMFRPTQGWEDIREFIVDCVRSAGPDACPPFIVGVGVGGTVDSAALLAKEALLRPVGSSSNNPRLARLERELLRKINRLHIGTMGLGGTCTALAVHVQTFPTHIAGLPVSVNISCHALRSASGTL